MLAFLLEIVLQLLVEVLVQFFAELLLELGFEAVAHSIRRGRLANPVLAAVGLLIIGAAAGFVSCWILPRPLFRPVPHFSGISLVLAPLATGAAMHAFGCWRRRGGGDPSLLATFWRGALFAFAMGLAPWVCVTRA